MEMYTAIDNNGIEYKRPAKTIDELPHEFRAEAMIKMRLVIESVIGEKLSNSKFTVAVDKLCYGIELFNHFDIPYSQVKTHPQSKLLLTRCGELPLSLIE